MIPEKSRAPAGLFSQKSGNRIFSEYFQIKMFPNGVGRNRFAAVVGAKIDKRSSQRHFWKRFILNAAMRQKNFSSDFVITARPALSGTTKKKAEADLSEIFKKLTE